MTHYTALCLWRTGGINFTAGAEAGGLPAIIVIKHKKSMHSYLDSLKRKLTEILFGQGDSMKKLMVLFPLFALGLTVSFAQENKQNSESGKVLYTGVVNMAPDQFNVPLIGVVNLARGSHGSAHIGVVNRNEKNLNGAQIGVVNANGGEHRGVQIGAVNATKQLRGLQIGVVNYVDEVKGGFPLGVISYVKNGGYRAVEYSATEISPVNLSLKLGLEKLYTTLYVGYNPLSDEAPWGMNTGVGLGSILRFTESFFFNSEVVSLNSTYGKDNILHLSFRPSIGFKLLPRLSVLAGPSVTLKQGKEPEDPFLNMAGMELDKESRIYAGAKLGIRYEW
jgi:hypothetical protein